MKLSLLVPALLLLAACGVADPLATDVEPQLRGCGPAPRDGFHGTCWWAEEDIILRDGAGEAVMGPSRGVGGPRVPSDRSSILGRYEEEFGGKALWMAVSPYNGERLPAGVLDMLEITVTPCVPPECRMLTAIHEDSPSDGERPDKGLVPIEIELYVTDATPTPTPTTAGRAASGRNHEDESDSESSDKASDTALEYPWSAPEQAQRDLAIQLRDASLLPECTEDYFRWRTETKVARETTSAAPPSTDFWSAPGCKGVPDRLVEGPPRTPSPP